MKIVRNRYFDKLVCDLDMRRIHRTTNITTKTHTIIAIEEVVIIVFFFFFIRVTMNQQAVLDDDQAVLGLFDKYCEL